MDEIKLFEQHSVRSYYDEVVEKWYFSIIDVIEVLTESSRPRRYWNDLKTKLQNEGSELSDQIGQLKMKSSDGKMRLTDVADVEQLFRLIQSIPSSKVEPFKQWLARVGYERLQEIQDPSQSLDRARENWQKMGRSEKWIQQRMTGQETRNKLTDYWKKSGVEQPNDFAFLTNIIHQEWAGLSVKNHKNLKGLKSQNLRDHMSEAELLFTALAELSTRQIAEVSQAQGIIENAEAGKQGGKIAKNARRELEDKTGKSVVTGENFLPPKKKELK
ncbi:Bro-N domain-containing protein [Lonepinella sp. MS14437]|uniref:BRO-N domain-containing protein n=1 Tax=unclassified Lonepinella TaxID=2642006 RepID=UPI0036DEA4DD